MYLLLVGENVYYSIQENNFPSDLDISWNAKVTIKDYSSFDLPYGSFINIGTTNNIMDDHFIPMELSKYYFMELLKSNLQKCVRRNLSQSAVRTCFQILNQDMIQLLRRLINIIAED